MEITRTDVGLLLSMFLVVWLTTSVFAQAGLASEDFNASDPPTLNLSDTDVNLFPEPPNPPLGSNQIRVSHNESGVQTRGRLNSTTSLFSSVSADQCVIQISTTTGTTDADTQSVDRVRDATTELSIDNWNVSARVEDPDHCTIIYTTENSPSSSGFIDFVVGGTAEGINAVASGIGTVANIVQTGVAFVLNTLATGVLTFALIGQFFVKYTGYLFGGYLGVLSSASAGWATPILLFPLLILSIVVAKIGFSIIESLDPLIPFT